MARIIKRFYPVSDFPIDGEPTRLRIARLTIDQFREFDTLFSKYSRRGQRRVEKLRAGVDETLEDQLHEQSAQDDVEAAAFIAQVIGDYVTAEAGQIFEEVDGQQVPVTTGADLLRLFGAQQHFVSKLLALIWGENKLAEKEKNAYRLALVSGNSSRANVANSPTADGPRPEPTVAPAAPADSTASEVVPATSTPTEDASSSTPDPS